MPPVSPVWLLENMSPSEDYPWVELYRAALLEVDPEKLRLLVEEAYEVLQQRAWELINQNSCEQERSALSDALQNLRVLRRELS
jgi:hypothetical protein